MRIFQGVDSYLDQSEHSPQVGGNWWRRELPICLYEPLVSGNIVFQRQRVRFCVKW